MPVYVAHGLTIRSDVPLPGLKADGAGEGTADVAVRLGRTVAPPRVEGPGEWRWRIEPREICFLCPDVGCFLVREGREIVVDEAPAADRETVARVLTGLAMRILLHQRGLLLLHASCVVLGEAAVAILGESGAGKSALAASLHRRGHRILSDDTVAVDVKADPARAYPAYPRFKLWPDTLLSLGAAPEVLPRVRPEGDKRARTIDDGFADGPSPLARIYVLAKGRQEMVEPLRPQETLVALARNSRTNLLLKPTNSSLRHFRQCEALARSVPASRLSRRESLSSLPRLAALVEDDLERTGT